MTRASGATARRTDDLGPARGMVGSDPGLQHTADRIAAELRLRHDVDDVEPLVQAEVRAAHPLADDPTRRELERAVRARLSGLDRLDPWLADPDVDEVLVGGGTVWVERSGRIEAVDRIDEATTRRVIERVIAPLGRRLDRTSPIVDARLPDGSRVCAVTDPVSVGGSTLSIRRFGDRVRDLDEFCRTAATRRAVELIVERRCNVLISGATSSGKTSLLGAVLALTDTADRIVVLEDVVELPCTAPHLVRLEARPPTLDGPPPITLEHLVRTALRLRPDRLVVGEVRGDEAVALVQAMNTGHDGSFSTCHANGPLDALLRLESLVVRAAPRWPLAAVRHTIARSIDTVVHVERREGSRSIADVVEVARPDDGAGTLSVRSIVGAELTRGRR